MIETTLRATSEKLWPGAGQDLWRPLDLAGMVDREILFDRRASLGGFEVALGDDPAFLAQGQDMARIVELGAQRHQPLVPLQHQEMRFRQPFGLTGIEAARAVLDGVAAVRQQCLAGLEFGPRQRLGGQAFDGIAVDTGDLCRGGGGHQAF
ncbi:hypothetical protein ACVJGD_004866 [Bradyrhizobium sp. USDA 10063]